MPVRSPTRTIPAPVVSIIPATDLGSVEVAKRGNRYLLTDHWGDIRIDGRGLGLYDLDTRILSTSILRLNGSALTLLRGPHTADGADTIQLTNPELRRNPADKRNAASSLARRELSVTRTRLIEGDLNERVMIVNYSETPEDLVLELGLGVDMADIFEVRGYPRAHRGNLLPIELRNDRVIFGYEGVDGSVRRTAVITGDARLEPVSDVDGWAGASVVGRWTAHLDAGARMTIGWSVTTTVEAPVQHPSQAVKGKRPATLANEARPDAERPFDAPRFQSDHELLDRTLVRSLADLAALRNDGPGDGEHYLAAGIPWFATLFGRDSIIASLETVAFMPSLAVATLEVLARLQATKDDPWHDAEPGKILHEMRTGEMARAGETPHSAYYGSVDSTPLWLILLGETFAWTGDEELLERLWPNALAALGWIDEFGDLDGDGFVEYQRRSKRGLLNQGWKDSGDSTRHLDGSVAEGPDRAGRGPGLRLRRPSRDGPPRTPPRREGAGRPARCRGRGAPGGVRRRVLAPRRPLLRDGARWREAPGREHHLEPRPGAVERDHPGPPSRRGRRATAGARHVLGLGRPDLRGRSDRLQPGRLPHGIDLAARQRDHRGRSQGDRRGRRGEPPRRAARRGRPVVPRPAPPRALLRVRPGGRRGAGRLSGRLLATGLVGCRARSTSSTRCWASARTPRRIAWNCCDRPSRTGSAS